MSEHTWMPALASVWWRPDGPRMEHALVQAPKVGGIFCLNPAAAQILRMCTGEHTPEEMAQQLSRCFEVSSDQALADVNSLLDLWVELGVLQPRRIRE